MTERKPLMAGNWKMNINHFEAIALVQKLAFGLNEKDLEAVEVAVLPPFTDVRSVQTLIEGDHYDIAYGGQDLSVHASGAFTGEVSGSMLAKLGCTFVVVGHSERRENHREDDALVNAKAKAALANNLVPIVCVGEGLAVRQSGGHVDFVLDQIRGSLDGLSADQVGGLVIAYEPVWGDRHRLRSRPATTPKKCARRSGETSSSAWEPHARSPSAFCTGGSVKAANAAGIMSQPDVDGCLVGGASLDPDEFIGIVRYRLHPEMLA